MSLSTGWYHHFEFLDHFNMSKHGYVRFIELAGKLANFVISSQDVVEARG